MLRTNKLGLVTLILLLAAAGGCIFSPDPVPPCTDCNVDPTIQFPDSEDKLMANFQYIYETMDIDEFRKMLHPQYITILQQSTRNTFPDVGETLDLEEELRIHDRMFSKQDVFDPLNNPVPGVQTIQFQTFQRVGVWATSPANDQIPNARNALYSVQFLFDRGQTYSTLKVTGNIRFYVTSHDSLVNGVVKPYFRMRGQADLTDDPPAK
jgi:hypothetical protein